MTKLSLCRRAALRAAAGAAAALALPSFAQGSPARPVTLVLPVPVGGGTDALARALQEPLRSVLGQPVIVDAKPGASGLLGSRMVARAPADGHTLLVQTNGIFVASHVYRNSGFDQLRDLEPVASLTTQPMVLVAHPSVPARDIKQLIAHARAHPGKLDYGSSGAAAIGRMAMELFLREAGIRMTHVPYKGAGQVLPALLSGEIKVAMTGASQQINQFVQSGRLVVLGQGSPEATSLVPGVRPIAETVKGFRADVWHLLSVPKGTPPDAVARLHEAIDNVMARTDVKKAMDAQSASYLPLAPAALHARVEQEYRTWGELVKQLGITQEE
jgi:tripartite-type tricarboxylate transporter receptor subunit TctC